MGIIIALLTLVELVGAAARFVCGPWPRQHDGETFQSFSEFVHWYWQYVVVVWDVFAGKSPH